MKITKDNLQTCGFVGILCGLAALTNENMMKQSYTSNIIFVLLSFTFGFVLTFLMRKI